MAPYVYGFMVGWACCTYCVTILAAFEVGPFKRSASSQDRTPDVPDPASRSSE